MTDRLNDLIDLITFVIYSSYQSTIFFRFIRRTIYIMSFIYVVTGMVGRHSIDYAQRQSE